MADLQAANLSRNAHSFLLEEHRLVIEEQLKASTCIEINLVQIGNQLLWHGDELTRWNKFGGMLAVMNFGDDN